MEKSKIILTTDDFGVDDSIDKGIIQLVRYNIIHSVEVLANNGENGKKSIERTLNLLDQTEALNPGLELGVHLTITSGKPISKSDGLSKILCNGHFISAKKTNSQAVPQAIYNELKAQIEVLKSNPRIWSKVTHLTNHHDALWFFPEYTEMYVQVARDFNLPIRNPRVMPAWNSVLYYKYIGPRNASQEDKEKSRRAYDFRQNGQFEKMDLNYRSSNYLDSSHYSLLRTILDANPYKPEVFIAQRQDVLRKVFQRVQNTSVHQNSPQIVEVLFHVREGGMKGSAVKLSKKVRKEKGIDAFDEYDLPDYNGVSTAYFDGRSIECTSLLWEHSSGGLKALYDNHQIEKGRWSDCIAQKLGKISL